MEVGLYINQLSIISNIISTCTFIWSYSQQLYNKNLLYKVSNKSSLLAAMVRRLRLYSLCIYFSLVLDFYGFPKIIFSLSSVLLQQEQMSGHGLMLQRGNMNDSTASCQESCSDGNQAENVAPLFSCSLFFSTLYEIRHISRSNKNYTHIHYWIFDRYDCTSSKSLFCNVLPKCLLPVLFIT